MQQQTLLKTEKSRLYIINNFTNDLFDTIITEIGELLENEPPIKIYGKIFAQPRDIGFFSDASVGYEYSHQLMKSKPLTPIKILSEILEKVNKELDTEFNGILVNLYTNGEKHIGAHSDSEIGLDKKKGIVAALSYGATRKFRIRDKLTKKIVLDVQTTPRSLIVMEGDFQKEFTHEIPIEKKIKSPRISLTFRHHIK